MTRPIRSFPTLCAAAMLATTAGACSDLPDPAGPSAEGHGPAFTRHSDEGAFGVYSQNVYLGGDTGPIFTLDFGNLPELLAATNTFWAQVLASDAAGRAAAVVDQIAARRPHVVGLQEVFQFRVVDFSTGSPEVVEALDLLALVQSELDARGLPYEVVAVQENTTTGPASGLPLAVDPGAGAVVRILQFTDRIAVLRRTDVAIEATAQGNFAASFQVGPLTLVRGWIRVSTEHRGVPQHFITTHLETQTLAFVQAEQAEELVQSIAAGLDGVTILAGDLNSDAANPGAPSWTPTYDALIAAGFTDAWAQSGQAAHDAGFTCCQAADLRNGPSLLDQRIDFVLVRATPNPARSGFVPGAIDVDITADRAEEGLWLSDHAGLAATLRLPPLE